MMQRDLKYWPLANRAIKFSIGLFTIVFLVPVSCAAQNEDPVKRAAYRLIADIIAKDTVVDHITYATLKNGMKTGKYSREDSIKVVTNIRSKELRLNKYAVNSSLKKELQRKLKKKKSSFIEYLGRDNVIKMLGKIPSDIEHDLTFIDEHIKIIEKAESKITCHFFSSPIHIDTDRYLLYHFDYDFMDGMAYLIVFTVEKNGSYKIQKQYQLWFS